VLRRVGPNTNNARSRRVGPNTNNARSRIFSVFHHLQKDKQRNQRHSLCEARKERTREFQTQLLHYFSKSNNKSNHHQETKQSV